MSWKEKHPPVIGEKGVEGEREYTAGVWKQCENKGIACRFLENEHVTMEKIQKSHYEATVDRIGKEKNSISGAGYDVLME